MLTITCRNVNEALPLALMYLREEGVRVDSRAGPTIEYPMPVATQYIAPWERVLFDPVRDANPFFHFFESLWILAGRDDVAWISQFNKRIAEYSDDGDVFHGAYGYRLRAGQGFDQISTAIQMLRDDLWTRRCVLQIWDAAQDFGTSSRDIPCNDLVVFRARGVPHAGITALDMTVYNRSNDAIWGAYGANAVHFSMLHEYVAAAVGVPMGRYWQVSNSLHVYTDNPQWEALKYLPVSRCKYRDNEVTHYSLARDLESAPREFSKVFDDDLHVFMDSSSVQGIVLPAARYESPFFKDVVIPMWNIYQIHQVSREGAEYANDIQATDWRLAVRQWLRKREENTV